MIAKDTRSVNQRYPMQSAGLRKPLQGIKKYAKKLTILLVSSNFQDSRPDLVVFVPPIEDIQLFTKAHFLKWIEGN